MLKQLTSVLFLMLLIVGCEQAPTEENQEAPNETDSTKVESAIIEKEYPELVQFPSLDSLLITANVYAVYEEAPMIVLCHQARYNKFEYDGIAQRLNELGFNCMAIDQRSGGPIGSAQNETYLEAKRQAKTTDFLDAEQDMIAAIDYAHERFGRAVILWGSSYSSTLALYIAVNNDKVNSVVSFSPGNYLAEDKGSLIDLLEGFNKPMFITCSKNEIPYAEELLQKLEMNEAQTFFQPEESGHHGSRALWTNQIGGEEYWAAIETFLSQLK